MENSLEKMVRERDPQAMQIKKLFDFSVKHGFDSKEMTKAYEMALGLEENDSPKPVREEIGIMAEKMKKFIDDGLALNRIVELINQKVDYESAPEKYYEMVNKMPINEKGKRMLISIVEKRRSGVITIFDDSKEKKLQEIAISKGISDKEYSQSDLAIQLIYLLDPFKDKKVEIMFSE